jgi:hypothetical protein
VLTPILATDDPYAAAAEFVRAGWTLDFETPRDGGDPLAGVSLHGASVMLGTAGPDFLTTEARPHRGAGVEFHVLVPDDALGEIHAAHAAAGAELGPLELRPWGQRAFHVRVVGYRFLIASDPGDARS